jgi:hypothetical protein
LIVGSGGANDAFATASAASGAVPLAHTRPAGWPISVTANQPTQGTGQASFRIGGDDYEEAGDTKEGDDCDS